MELLVDAGLGEVQVLLEMATPLTDIRMDMVLVGSHPRHQEISVVVVENKQWSRAVPVPYSELVSFTNPAELQVVHPVNQVWGYRQVLNDFIPLLRDTEVYCVANLHNAPGSALQEIRPSRQGLAGVDEMRGHAQMYGLDERPQFRRRLESVLAAEGAEQYARDLLEAPVKPTETLMSVAGKGLGRRTLFTLLDEQRAAYDHVRAQVAQSRSGDFKEVAVIVGGPGTGKSVVALELMRTLYQESVSTVHATGSRSFTNTLRREVGERSDRTFGYFNGYATSPPNSVDVLLADEAHRIRTKPGAPAHDSGAMFQAKGLIRAARVPVFFLDENQQVRPNEIGGPDVIEAAARDLGVGVQRIDLRRQFRCNGSPEYLEWVDRLMGFVPEGPGQWSAPQSFDLRVAESPQQMEEFLQGKAQQGMRARIAAGYCWPWSPPNKDGTLVEEVVIGDWRRPWNVKPDYSAPGAPSSDYWATDPRGAGQVGCVYTAQGFEYDYAGVIFGPDLVWGRDRWISWMERSHDPGAKARGQAEFHHLVRNTYRVLATRGLRGAVFYSVDPDTNFFFSLLGVPQV
ncbi:DUF2075 domain-containing protein [Nocardiopsis coralliicola]